MVGTSEFLIISLCFECPAFLRKETHCSLFYQNVAKNYGGYFLKGKCAQEGTFLANRFPSLGNFAKKKVGFRKN